VDDKSPVQQTLFAREKLIGGENADDATSSKNDALFLE
jgi:hypothetical protein